MSDIMHNTEGGALYCRECRKWGPIECESAESPGMCIQCAIDAAPCPRCAEHATEFSEVEMRGPAGLALVEMCVECCTAYNEDPEFGYRDDE